MNFKEEYKSGLDKISFDENFSEKTMELIRESTPGKTTYSRKSLWTIIAVASVLAILLSITLFPTTAKTVMQLPDNAAERVADSLGFKSVDDLLRSKSVMAINETIVDSGYKITLHGIVNRSRYESCIIASVERLDGTDIEFPNEIMFTAYVKGYYPHITYGAMGSGGSRFIIDGTMYCLSYTQPSLKIFADSTIYIVASDEAIAVSALTPGDANITYDESYDGPRAMFEVHLDPSDADHKAVEKLLGQFE